METRAGKNIWLIMLILSNIGGQFIKAQSAEPNIDLDEHTISFPTDYSMGVLSVRDWGSLDTVDWTILGEARGEVTVPAGKELKLKVPADYKGDFSPLTAMEGYDLRELILNHTKVSDNDLIHLKNLTAIKRLFLSWTPITDAGLVHLKDLPQLELLHVHDTAITDDGLIHMEQMTGLQRLDVGKTKVTDAALVHLKGLTNLKGLNLNWTEVTDDGLVNLKRLKNLEWLNLYATKVEGSGLVHLKGITKLKSLYLSKTPITDAGLANLKDLTSLGELYLEETNISDDGLVNLKEMKSLKLLNLNKKPVTAGGGHPLLGKPLGELKFTSLKGEQIDISQYKGKVVLVDFWATWCGPCIGELPNVKNTYDKYRDDGFEIIGISLDRDQSRLENFIQDNDMPWPQYFDGKGWENKIAVRFDIHSIPSTILLDGQGIVRYANLRGSALERAVAEVLEGSSLPNVQITDAGLAHLKALTSLETLRLENTQITNEGLAHLTGLTSLKKLYLAGTQITDAGLAHVKNLVALEWLCVHRTEVTDDGLGYIKDLTGLRYLCLHDTFMSDEGLVYLKGLTSLKTLYLHNTHVSDAGLEHLKDLAALEKLSLGGTRVSKAGLTDIKNSLPNCSISGQAATKPLRPPKRRPGRRPEWPSIEQMPLHLRILSAAIIIPIVCFLSALFLKIVTGWAVKFSISYWTAYKIEIIATVISFIIRVSFNLPGILWTLLLSFVVHLFVHSIIYGQMIKYPDTNEPIGFGRGLLIWFYFMLIWIPLAVIVGCAFACVLAIFGYIARGLTM